MAPCLWWACSAGHRPRRVCRLVSVGPDQTIPRLSGGRCRPQIQSAPRVELWSLEPRGGEICDRSAGRFPGSGARPPAAGPCGRCELPLGRPAGRLEIGGPTAAVTGLDGPLPPGAWDVAWPRPCSTSPFSEGPGSPAGHHSGLRPRRRRLHDRGRPARPPGSGADSHRACGTGSRRQRPVFRPR